MRSAMLALVTLALAAPAFAQAAGDNGEIRAVAQAFDDAQQRGDRAALERILAPDYLLVHGSGRIGDRKDFIDGFTDPQSHLEPFDIRDRVFLRPASDTAIVGGEAWVRGTDHGKTFRQHFRYSDIFVRRNGQWVVVYTQVTPLPLS
jgi:ketosteroid isomerase-like protein